MTLLYYFSSLIIYDFESTLQEGRAEKEQEAAEKGLRMTMGD